MIRRLAPVDLYQMEPIVFACSYCKWVFKAVDGTHEKLAMVQDYESVELPVSGWSSCPECKKKLDSPR